MHKQIAVYAQKDSCFVRHDSVICRARQLLVHYGGIFGLTKLNEVSGYIVSVYSRYKEKRLLVIPVMLFFVRCHKTACHSSVYQH